MADLIITEQGLRGDIPEDVYHADCVPGGSLSGTSAKKLLAPSCPAMYDYERRHPKTPTQEMQRGTVVHALILGTPDPAEVIAADNWNKKDDQAKKKAALKAGKIPMLTHEYEQAKAIAQAVRDDEDAGPLFDEGDAEQSMFWRDPEFGIWCRGRIDWLTYVDGQPLIADVKTCSDASPEEFARSVGKYRYDMQDIAYRQGLAVILGCDWQDLDFVFVAVPTAEPYLVMTYRLENPHDIENGLESCRIAREKYAACSESGIWPKWSQGITPLELPVYARRQIESGINEWHN